MVKVYNLMAGLKTLQPTICTSSPPSPGHWTFSFVYHYNGEHTVLQPFHLHSSYRTHFAIFVLPGTHLHLSQVKQQFLKILQQADFETASQTATKQLGISGYCATIWLLRHVINESELCVEYSVNYQLDAANQSLACWVESHFKVVLTLKALITTIVIINLFYLPDQITVIGKEMCVQTSIFVFGLKLNYYIHQLEIGGRGSSSGCKFKLFNLGWAWWA